MVPVNMAEDRIARVTLTDPNPQMTHDVELRLGNGYF